MSAARMTEPEVGACTCASGSQVWTGHIGTLMKNAIENAQKHQNCAFFPSTTRESARRSHDQPPVRRWKVHTR